MAQRPPSLQARRQQQSDQAEVLRFRLEGVEYTLDRGELTPALERELYQQAGVTPQACFQALAQGARFGLAGLVFLSRRQAGERVAYGTVESDLWAAYKAAGEDLELELIEGDDDGGDAGPPAPGGGSAA